MEKIRIYFRPIWYNIMHHKAYAGFCVFGTMLTFLFVMILLQIIHVVQSNTTPALYAERVIGVPSRVLQEQGNGSGRQWKREDMETLMSLLKGYENYICCHDKASNFKINGQLGTCMALYTDYNYWNVFHFNFVQGNPFPEREQYERCAIVKESLAKMYFAKEDVLGEEIYFQGNTYRIIGVVADVSLFAQDGNISLWLPLHSNQEMVNENRVSTYILFPEGADIVKAKTMVANVVNRVAEMKNININLSPEKLLTVQEVRAGVLGMGLMGSVGAILILLAIPVLNIILLSSANTSIQVSEIGIKRALGANRNFVFLEILVENIILVMVGILLGVVLLLPVCQYIDRLLFANTILGTMTILAEVNWMVIFLEVLPLSLLFSLVSGGLPSYGIVRFPIVDMLKGGVK